MARPTKTKQATSARVASDHIDDVEYDDSSVALDEQPPDEQPATQHARLLNTADVITSDTYTIVDGPDRKGCYGLINDNTARRSLAHPTRILRLQPGGAPVRRTATCLVATCPACGDGSDDVAVQVGDVDVVCQKHGPFIVDWSTVEPGPRPAPPIEPDKKQDVVRVKREQRSTTRSQRQAKAHCLIDFDSMREVGELWWRPAQFDYPGYEVKAYVLIIVDGDNTRKMCFNSYNGTWGKKSNDENLRRFLKNERAPGNKMVGYYIKGPIEKERQRLEKDGYVMEEADE